MNETRHLLQALRQLVGNKIYLRDLEKTLEKLGDLSPQEKETLRFLARDLEDASRKVNQSNRPRFY